MAKRVLKAVILSIGAVHVLLLLFADLPLVLFISAILAHWEYYTFLGSFPFFRMPSIPFFVAIGARRDVEAAVTPTQACWRCTTSSRSTTSTRCTTAVTRLVRRDSVACVTGAGVCVLQPVRVAGAASAVHLPLGKRLCPPADHRLRHHRQADPFAAAHVRRRPISHAEGRFDGKRSGNFLSLMGYVKRNRDKIIDMLPLTPPNGKNSD